MSDFIEIPASQDDPRGKRLAAVLSAEQRAEEWIARSTLSGRLCVLFSVPMAYLFVRGAGTASFGARLVLSLWAVALVAFIGCAAAAVRAQRIVDALLKRASGQRINTDD